MKKAKEWFEQLPEPIRTQAMENWEKSEMDDKNDLFERIEESIDTFVWRETPQGADYWSDIWNQSMKGKFPNLHGWIPVSERLPTSEDADEFGHVLILREVNESQKNTCKSIIAYNMVRHSEKETTMWQPLPKLPEVRNV